MTSMLTAVVFSLCAVPVTFPADAGAIDVTKPPYNARGDGKTDDTAALQKALSDHMGGGTLYLPDGTYLISSTLKWSNRDAKGRPAWGNVTVQGQSADKTILRLKDGTFSDSKKPQTVMWCGGFGSADWFHNYVKDLTIDIGKNNPGAVALQFYSNNTGSVRNVRLLSGDGQGAVGLDLAHRGMNGPLLVKNVEVKGFRIGILAGHGVNSQTLDDVRLEGQTEAGLVNRGQSLSVHRLHTSGSPVGVRHEGGHLVLIGSTLEGKGPHAIDNRAILFVRGLTTKGFDTALKSTRGKAPSGTDLTEWVSEPVLSLFPSEKKSLNLPIKDAPEVPRDEVTKWANVRKYHKGGDDWTPAIQAAIDSGAETVYFPAGAYKIGKTVHVRGKVRRLVGMNSWLAESAGKFDPSVPRFRIETEGPEVVVMENFRGGFGARVFVEYTGKRTFILRESSGVPAVFRGEGDVFLEDITGCPWGGFVLDGPQRVWARQFNVEMFVKKDLPATLDVSRSSLWVLGLKTEQGNRLVAARKGAKVEIAGGLIYTVSPHEGRPAFVIEDAALSLSVLEQCFIGKPMDPVVRETQGGTSRDLKRGGLIGLFTSKGLE